MPFNTLSDGIWSYTWEHGRQLASMTSGNTTWTYSYNLSGLRESRSNGSTTYNYIYDGDQLAILKIGGNTLRFAYDANGQPWRVEYNGASYYYSLNAQGDVVGLANSNGERVVSYTYDAWGNVLSIGGSMANTLGQLNPLRYRGYVYDQETKLYYLQSRYYNPEMGRFLNADSFASTGQGILGNNMFSYCQNNPVNMSDPTGRFPLTALCIAIIIGGGTLVGGLLGAFSALTTDGNVLEATIEGAITGAAGTAFGLLAPQIGVVWAFVGASTFALATDITIQAHFNKPEVVDFSPENIDLLRAFDIGLQTGLGTIIPAFGNPLKDQDVINAIGTAVAWGEYSALVSCADVALTNVWETITDHISDAWESICIWP